MRCTEETELDPSKESVIRGFQMLNGSSPKDIVWRTHPQSPIPVSSSSAEMITMMTMMRIILVIVKTLIVVIMMTIIPVILI